MVQLPRLTLLNVTASPATGTLKPPAPPETFDQLAVLFQLDGAAETQKRLAACVWKDRDRTKTKHRDWYGQFHIILDLVIIIRLSDYT